MKFLVVSVLLLFFAGASVAQDSTEKKQRLDSLNLKLQTDSLHTFRFKKLRPYGNIDNRNSIIRPSNFNGYQLGVIVNEYHTFGVGFYRLNGANEITATVKQGYRLRGLRYNTVFYQYLLINKKYFGVYLPFELGYGSYRARIIDTLSPGYYQLFTSSFLPVSASVEFIAKPVRWIGLSAAVGYRYFLQKDNILDFNGFYFPIGIWVDLRQVYRDIKYYGVQRKRYRRQVKKVMADT